MLAVAVNSKFKVHIFHGIGREGGSGACCQTACSQAKEKKDVRQEK